MERYKCFGIILVIFVALLSLAVLISFNKFDTTNPIKTGTALAKIMFTKTEIVQIQEYPLIYLAKPANAQQTLINFMEQRGYKYLEDERMASTLAFGNETSKNYVQFSVNKYYSKWVFNK